MIHKPKSENYDITTIRTSTESHIHWKDHCHKNPIQFRSIADFEVDTEIEDNKDVCNRTTIYYKQNPVLKGYIFISELDDVLQSKYYESLLGHDNVDWIVD